MSIISANDYNGIVPVVLDHTLIAALRKADRVVFQFNNTPDPADRSTGLRAIKEAPKATPANPFPQECEVRIACDSIVTNYESEFPASRDSAAGLAGFALIYGYEQHWQTITSLLRPGDTLTLKWNRGGCDTDATRACEPRMVGDTLSLRVDRPSKRAGADGTSMHFNLKSYFGHANTARMVRGPDDR